SQVEDKLFSSCSKRTRQSFTCSMISKRSVTTLPPSPLAYRRWTAADISLCTPAMLHRPSVVHHIQNQRRCRGACRQGPADLLLINDGRHRGPEQDDPGDPLYMNAFVQHVDAEQQLETAAVIV